jgi:hypothetical protein
MLSVRYRGRDFTLRHDIRAIIGAPEKPRRAAIAEAVRRQCDRRKPDGGMKVMSDSGTLRRMHADGWMDRLPPRQRGPPPRTRHPY